VTRLRGIAWDHTRGYVPAAATGQAYHDTHPEIEIEWERRSLWAFGEQALSDVASRFDLIVIDHPLIGDAVAQQLLVPIDQFVPEETLDALRAGSVGRSFESYTHDGRQWALPIDAAAQVSAWRPDLLDRVGGRPPASWDELLALAAESRRVAVPLKAIDALSLFFTLCAQSGTPPLSGNAAALECATVEECLQRLEQLAAVVDHRSLDWNPIDLLRLMSSSDEIIYSPFLFGYSNYSRPGFARHLVTFGPPPQLVSGVVGGTTLGGTGIAVSRSCDAVEAAVAYASWVATPECQGTLYLSSGGQPAQRMVWTDDAANRLCGGFFAATLETLERAYLRPNLPGMPQLQAEAGDAVYRFLRGEAPLAETATTLCDQATSFYDELRVSI